MSASRNPTQDADQPGDPRDPLERETLWFLVGPTAAGKSELALALAERLGAEILSLDSMLVYRGVDVGTAKPSPADRARVPHHLLDLVEPHERFTAQDYVAAARSAVGDLQSRGKRGIFVGGTGLYLKLLTSGLFDGPEIDAEVRARLSARYDELGPAGFHAELERIDSASARRLHPNDKKRVVRALEVFEQTGRPLSHWQQEWRGVSPRRWRIAGLDVGVAELDRRIAARTQAMLDAGWADEARRVREGRGFGPTAGQALGYAEVLELLDGRLTLAACAERIAQRTRQFARRQRTWFRKFPELVWFDPKTTNPAELLDGVRQVFER